MSEEHEIIYDICKNKVAPLKIAILSILHS